MRMSQNVRTTDSDRLNMRIRRTSSWENSIVK
jgi:hypothetical protein